MCVCVCVQMQVWDTAGQERFRTITQSYYRSAHGAMIAYDISRRATFDSVQRWVHELQRFGAANVLTALIGTDVLLQLRRLCDQVCRLNTSLFPQVTSVTWRPSARSASRRPAS